MSVQITGDEEDGWKNRSFRGSGADVNEDVRKMAAYLGLDPAKDVEFFWIADEALDAPLPDGWAEHEDAHGPFFYHVTSKRAYRQHPLDDYFKQLVHNIRDKQLPQLEARIEAAKSAPWAPPQAFFNVLRMTEEKMRRMGSMNQPLQPVPSTLERMPTSNANQIKTALSASTEDFLKSKEQIRGLEEKLKRSEDQTRSVEEKLRRAEDRCAKLEDDIDRERARSEQMLEKALRSAAEAAFHSGNDSTSVQILKEENRRRADEVEVLKKEVVDERRKREEEAESLRRKLEEAHKEASAHREAEAALRATVASWNQDVQSSQSNLKSAFEDLKIAQQQLHLAQMEALRFKTEGEVAAREKELIQAQLESAQARLSDLGRTTDSSAQEVRDLRAALQQQKDTAAQLDRTLQQTRLEAQQIQKDLTRVRQERDKLAAAPPPPPPPVAPQVVQVDNPQLQIDLQRTRDELQRVRDELQRTKEELARALAAQTELQATRLELQRYMQESQYGKTESTHLKDELKRARDDLAAAREDHRRRETELEQAKSRLREIMARADTLQVHFSSHAEEIARRDAGLAAVQMERRRLFNELLQLKGNIRVFCRVRPISESEKAQSGTAQVFSFPDKGLGLGRFICLENDGRSGGRQENKTFEFDRVFGPGSTQDEVFEDVQPLVQSVLDGFNVTIFAYGQTGSGKTHTIEGSQGNRGVTYRAFEEIFRQTAGEGSDGKGVNLFPSFRFEFRVQLFEIYNETIRDLLVSSREKDVKPHDIKTDESGMTYVTDLNEIVVHSAEDFVRAMKQGGGNRAVAGTNMNQHSSRSHLIMLCHADCYERATNTRKYTSKLCLVDLAGSERVGKSGAEGDRLKEAIAINKSLSALGDCISALASKAKGHIPFRNSKLTYVLSDSLGNDAKTLLIVNCSPALYNAQESSCTLMFAARARNVDLSAGASNSSMRQTLQRQQQVQRELEARCSELEENNSRLRQEIANKGGSSSSAGGASGGAALEQLERENKMLRAQLAELTQKLAREGGSPGGEVVHARANGRSGGKSLLGLGTENSEGSLAAGAVPVMPVNRLQPVSIAVSRPSRVSRPGDP